MLLTVRREEFKKLQSCIVSEGLETYVGRRKTVRKFQTLQYFLNCTYSH